MNTTDNTLNFKRPCRYLRNKEMFYQGADDDAFASGLYWCSKTQENCGPDGSNAGKTECCTGRSCYVD